MSNCKSKCPLKASRHNDDYTLGYCDGLQQGGANATSKCTEILARLVAMELIDIEVYELVKAEMEQKNERIR